jgi:hypothetical protein
MSTTAVAILLGFFCFVSLVTGLVLLFMWLQDRKTRASIERVAQKWNGALVGGGFGKPPELKLNVADVEATMLFKYKSREKDPLTRISFNIPSVAVLRIMPKGWLGRLKRLFVSDPVRTGSKRFDDRFTLAGDPDLASSFLDLATQEDLLSLFEMDARFLSGSSLLVTVGSAGLVVHLESHIFDDSEMLDIFVQLSSHLLLRLQKVLGVAGISILETHRLAKGTCPVCFMELIRDVLECRVCKTPHHEDCWDYFRGCAIFGCQSQRTN